MLICLVRMAQIKVERPAKPPNTCTNKQFKRNISNPSISYKQNTWQKRLHRIAQDAQNAHAIEHAIEHDTHDWTWYTWVNMIEQLTFWVHGQIFTPKGPPGQTIQHLKQESLKTCQSDKSSTGELVQRRNKTEQDEQINNKQLTRNRLVWRWFTAPSPTSNTCTQLWRCVKIKETKVHQHLSISVYAVC